MHLIRTIVALALISTLSNNVYANVFHIDEFSITKNGGSFFTDSFDDGNPPPSAPNLNNGNPISYAVKGTMGPETGGKLTLDSVDGEADLSISGDPFLFQSAILKTNKDSSNTAMGLKIDDTLLIQAIYDLTIPAAVGDAYGINFTDRATSIGLEGDDIVGLRVINTTSGVNVQFFEASRVHSTFSLIDTIALESGHDQILLELARDDVNTKAVTASFAYIDGGITGSSQSLTGSADIFNGENWTRAQFVTRTVIPIPAAMWLFASGLIGLIGVARRKKSY